MVISFWKIKIFNRFPKIVEKVVSSKSQSIHPLQYRAISGESMVIFSTTPCCFCNFLCESNSENGWRNSLTTLRKLCTKWFQSLCTERCESTSDRWQRFCVLINIELDNNWDSSWEKTVQKLELTTSSASLKTTSSLVEKLIQQKGGKSSRVAWTDSGR